MVGMREDLRRLRTFGLCGCPLAVYSQRIFNTLRDQPASNAFHKRQRLPSSVLPSFFFALIPSCPLPPPPPRCLLPFPLWSKPSRRSRQRSIDRASERAIESCDDAGFLGGGYELPRRFRPWEEDHPQERPLPRMPEQELETPDRWSPKLSPGWLLHLCSCSSLFLTASPSRRLRSFFSDCLACRCVYNWPPRFALFHVYLFICIQIMMPKAAIESWEVGGRAPRDCHGRLTVWLTRVHHSQQRWLYLTFLFTLEKSSSLFIISAILNLSRLVAYFDV